MKIATAHYIPGEDQDRFEGDLIDARAKVMEAAGLEQKEIKATPDGEIYLQRK